MKFLKSLLVLGVVSLFSFGAHVHASCVKECVPAFKALPPAPNPCKGEVWEAAFPGTCSGEEDVPKCRVDGTTIITIRQYGWEPDENGNCVAIEMGNTKQVPIGQCINM